MSHPILLESAGGEYMESAVIVEWTRRPGDAISAGEVIVVVETAKAASEVEAAHSGYLQEILFQPGEEAPIGAVLGRIGDAMPAAPSAEPDAPAALPASPEAKSPADAIAPGPRPGSRIVATPLARRVARERGVDLAGISGTGPRGRIKLRDLERASASPAAAAAAGARPARELAPAAGRAPVVFIHGFGGDKTVWSRVLPLLDRAHMPILIELPGHGAAGAAPVAGFDALVDLVAEELEARGVSEAHLVGHSLGGAVALGLFRLGRIAIHSMCLIAPAGLGPEMNAGFVDGLVNARSPESLLPWLDVMTGDGFALPDGYAHAVLRQWRRSDVQSNLRRMADAIFPDGTQSMRLADVLADLPVPAKILWGLDDGIIPSRHAFAAHGAVALHLLKGIGHVPQIECPELTARLIDELARNA